MSEKVKKYKQVCTCENCGNEAEMMITCSLEDVHEHTEGAASSEAADEKTPRRKVKGSATCTHCGNEADMWIDI
jgi:ribosomal protein S14